MSDNRKRRSTATLLGVAYGDAMGRNTEFVYKTEEIIRRNLVVRDLPTPALVTDDTDMTRYVARALLKSEPTPDALADELCTQFVSWLDNMDGGRKPGGSCIAAARRLSVHDLIEWHEATDPFAKGCGANMRVAPVALDTRLVPDFENVAGAAQLQAAITHGHPTALVAAELTAYAIWLARWENVALRDIPDALLDRCDARWGVYREDWLGDLDRYWKMRTKTGFGRGLKWRTAREAMIVGYRENMTALMDLTDELLVPDDGGDVSRKAGAGWVAEEALATALLAAIRHEDDPVRALMRAATTSGDSDSLASICGALHGAAYGMDAWPQDWAGRVEFGDELASYGKGWE